jgi:uncharacterized membrane protein YeaQ/YmgE (transglycosylase-associated protein family)
MIPTEHIMQMGPMLVLAALMMGLLAETVWRAGGNGLLNDMILGLAGSLVVGGIFLVAISSHVGMVVMVLVGCGGGALAIIAQRMLWRSTRPGSEFSPRANRGQEI